MKVEDYYEKNIEETANEYFERRKKEIYARADYKKETLEDMERMKKILNGVLECNNRDVKKTTADELVEDLNKFFDERGINTPTVVRTAFVYVCELKCL